MTSLADELTALDADTDTVQQALRYYLAERLDDLPPEEMLDRMYQVAGRTHTDTALAELTQNAQLLEHGALAILATAWADESERPRVKSALIDAKAKLPVIEISVIAMACMYGLYLLVTGGIKKSDTTIIRKPDGSFEVRQTIEYSDPARPLGAIANIFRSINRTQNPADHSEIQAPDEK